MSQQWVDDTDGYEDLEAKLRRPTLTPKQLWFDRCMFLVVIGGGLSSIWLMSWVVYRVWTLVVHP